ncbi:MAG: hypothetical protein AAGC68_09565, partial [Verrucomicrobiota bacterium]
LSAFDLVSVDSSGQQGDRPSFDPSLSADGNRIVFLSQSQLAPQDTDTYTDVYLHDRTTAETTLVSIGTNGSSADRFCSSPMISADGNHVVFASSASNLVTGITVTQLNVFHRNLTTGTTTLISKDTMNQEGNASSGSPSISANGSRIVFNSSASNLLSGGGGFSQIYLWENGNFERVSKDQMGADANGDCFEPEISSDGGYVVFTALATNLHDGPADTNNATDIIWKKLANNKVGRISISSNLVESNGDSRFPRISTNGRFVTFWSRASNLLGAMGDTNNLDDIFVHDVENTLTTLVTVDEVGNPVPPTNLITPVVGSWISGDGEKILFVTSGLQPIVGNQIPRAALYEYNRNLGTSRMIDRTFDGREPNGDVKVYDVGISLDGNVIAYASDATDISYSDTNANVPDVFVMPGTPRTGTVDPFAALRARLAKKMQKLKRRAKAARRNGQSDRGRRLMVKVRKLTKRIRSLS